MTVPSIGPALRPVRQISRLAMELHASGAAEILALHPSSYDEGIVLQLLARVALPDWIEHGRLRRPERATLFCSINSIAASLDRPFETIRRYIRSLAAQGVCTIGSDGVALATTPSVASRLIAYLEATHDHVVRFGEDLGALGLLGHPRHAGDGEVMPAILATALDIQLLPHETFRGPIRNSVSWLIWGIISAACVRHVLLDPELSARYAFESTPDDLRRPIDTRTLATSLGMPNATVWRHLRKLEQHALISRKDGGWIVGAPQLLRDDVEANVHVGVRYYLRRMSDLVRDGFDPQAAATYYLHARPPLFALGIG